MADLSGFYVASLARDEFSADTMLFCRQCGPGDPSVVATTDGSVPFSVTLPAEATLAELLSAANRHTWERHRHPRL